MIRIKLFYARDFRALLLKYGRIDAAAWLIGGEGQAVPAPGRRSGASARRRGDRHAPREVVGAASRPGA